MDAAAAQKLLAETVKELFDNRKRPVLGSQLKPALLEKAKRAGDEFDEKALGYAGFIDFVSSSSEVAVRPRGSGLDFVAVPAQEQALLAEGRRLPFDRIREDFWRAFTVFARAGLRRVYDKSEDRIFYEDETKPLGPHIVIEPISKDQQLVWRKEFATGLQEDLRKQLLTALQTPAAFGAFNLALSANPAVFKDWHRFKIQKVRAIIQAWADLNRIPREAWSVSREVERSTGGRAELYALLDQLPLERLLELQIPIRWLLEARRQTREMQQKP